MRFKVVIGDVKQFDGDAIIVSIFEEEPLQSAAAEVDAALEGAISALRESGEITGKLNEVTVLYTLGKLPAQRVAVVGLGKREELELDRIRQAAAVSSQRLRKAKARRLASVVHGAGLGSIEPEQAAQAVVEGTLLGLYEFRTYKTEDEEDHSEVEELVLIEQEKTKQAALERGVEVGQITAEATNLVRDLVNTPANDLTPTKLAQRAQEIAATVGLECEVLGREQMAELGLNLLLGVAQGSAEEPQFIILRYRGGPEDEPALGLVGKAITFDSGGLSLKSGESMESMKDDMAGGAAILGAMQAIAKLHLPLNVTALIPATENLPSGTAQRPGDIRRALNGKTVEILSTDAEGRLILADALAYAEQMGLAPIIDLATLTGSCFVALGNVCCGGFSPDEKLLDRLVAVGRQAGEKIWPLPLFEEYREQIKSDNADLKNIGGKGGGACTAAKFLQEFVGEDTPWVHLDIAGVVMRDKAQHYYPKGATGFGVRTLVNYAISQAKRVRG